MPQESIMIPCKTQKYHYTLQFRLYQMHPYIHKDLLQSLNQNSPDFQSPFKEFSPLLLPQEFYIAFKFSNNEGRQSGHLLTRHGVGARRFHLESHILIWGFDRQILFQFQIMCFMIQYGKL